MNKIWKHILLIGLITLFITATGLLLFYPLPDSPVSAVENARIKIYEARSQNAGIYSDSLFREAQKMYDSAMHKWQKENEKFLYSRSFDSVSLLANMAAQKAVEALTDSKNNTLSLIAEAEKRIREVKKTSEALVRRFSDYPLAPGMRKNISRGEILISEARHAMEKGSVAEACKMITEAGQLINPAYEYADANLRNWFRSYNQWKEWADTTIEISRNNGDYSIIVDKYSRKVIVYLKGEVRFTCRAELGKNWVGDKRMLGDHSTPEGMYHIVKKFESDSTQYYKALLLNYPNKEDSVLFESSVRRGILPHSASPGGLIEIHGNGGKGSDWTAGCIAVTNREMDTLFSLAGIGTPVTIVGSMKELRSVMIR
ncbi:MAG TPA: L,D-transpeptidase family protein [Bacteroidales bacterium]|nr:L,D-transpeptidase family protein [Bacteroidales bacterium]HPF04201.1 L,D-transpeptidase family protein [Bacteroidales bacterium]HPJ60899.1 L,D-transpeptidase family protein [Bacteroidales bacterium]HPR13664.1 L,D-transpeptidase family protein [Bacteroidales bacterium]HRW84345.1 L,D-transpeptidase family protein [Bacteroidales bacterium]